MAQLELTFDAPASPPADEKDRPRDRKAPVPDDEAPETPPTDPEPVPVQDPPSEPGRRGPFVV
jgi:hypothetical protein